VLRDALFASIDVGRRHLLNRNAECMLEIAEQARRFVR
jgi:hypothetical protein